MTIVARVKVREAPGTAVFARAIRSGDLFQAKLAAREMGYIALPEALDLVALIAQQKPERFEAAAVRLHGGGSNSQLRS